ncbi:MAG: hypothetical protein P1U53_11135 [Sulfitobacter sp.]|nr:hypothetical protein [Sulfitobacter sp.]
MTVNLLRFINEHATELKKAGVKIVPKMITADQLRDPRVVKALRAKGIQSFPALKTPNHIYMGLGNIIEVYKESLYQYNVWLNKQKSGGGAVTEPEDEYRQFVSSSMSFKAAKDTDDEAMVGNIDENKDMMGKMHEMVRKRQSRQAKSTGASTWGAPAGGNPPTPSRGASAVDAQYGGGTPDGGVTGGLIDKAYADSGSDEPHIDALMKQYYENQLDSI